jgi:hypothetical protein
MTSADMYRAKALEFFTMARAETNPHLKAEFASMAQSYSRLSVLADKNQENDVVYETPTDAPAQKP